MNYLAYHFIVNPVQPGSDILIALTSDLGFESFDINENGFSAFIQSDAANNLNIDELQFEDFKFAYTIEKIANTNWNAEWERNFEPVLVDDLLVIRAPFHEKNSAIAEEIVIMPKMSFGTGHHQTTRLMCRQLFDLDLKNKRVLDMGCGTGILAILSVKRGASEVIGIDIDDWCVENSQENCTANNCNQIIIKKGDVEALENFESFDCIIANINKNILKTQMSAYSRKLYKNGILLLSGFFVTDVEELKAVADSHDFDFRFYKNEDEWAMMVLAKR